MKKSYLIPAMAALMLAACNSNEVEEPDGADRRVPVEFRGAVSVTETRAIDQTWTNDDAIGIFMVTAGADFLPVNICEGAENIPYATHTAALGTFAPTGTTIYYPMDNSEVDFYAYYPQGTVTTGGDPVHYLYALDVATQGNQEKLDFMYSDNVKRRNKTLRAAQLAFSHRLCKVILTVTPGEGVDAADMTGLTVKVNSQNTTATFDLSTGTLNTDASTPKNITLFKQPDVYVYEAILLPDDAASRTFEFDLNNGNDAPFAWEMEKTLTAGNKYTYTVKLNRTGVEVAGTIGEWGSGDNGEVDAH